MQVEEFACEDWTSWYWSTTAVKVASFWASCAWTLATTLLVWKVVAASNSLSITLFCTLSIIGGGLLAVAFGVPVISITKRWRRGKGWNNQLNDRGMTRHHGDEGAVVPSGGTLRLRLGRARRQLAGRHRGAISGRAANAARIGHESQVSGGDDRGRVHKPGTRVQQGMH